MIYLSIFIAIMSVALVAYSTQVEGRFCLALSCFVCGFSVALCVAQYFVARSLA